MIDAMENLKKRVAGYERTMEDLILKIKRETDPAGLAIYVNTTPIIYEFNEMMNILIEARKNYKKGQGVLVPGLPDKEE